MTAAVRNRALLAGALLVGGGALAFLALGNLGENLVYYWAPGEMLDQGKKAYGATIRLGGVVKEGSIQWDANKTSLRFQVADGKEPTARSVEVQCSEVPPQMFREGIGVVVEGTFTESKVFTSSRLMVNHSNEYRAPKAGEEGKDDWKKTVSQASPSESK